MKNGAWPVAAGLPAGTSAGCTVDGKGHDRRRAGNHGRVHHIGERARAVDSNGVRVGARLHDTARGRSLCLGAHLEDRQRIVPGVGGIGERSGGRARDAQRRRSRADGWRADRHGTGIRMDRQRGHRIVGGVDHIEGCARRVSNQRDRTVPHGRRTAHTGGGPRGGVQRKRLHGVVIRIRHVGKERACRARHCNIGNIRVGDRATAFVDRALLARRPGADGRRVGGASRQLAREAKATIAANRDSIAAVVEQLERQPRPQARHAAANAVSGRTGGHAGRCGGRSIAATATGGCRERQRQCQRQLRRLRYRPAA